MPLPPPGTDKEDRGRALVIGGSARVPGAALLAAEATLRVGAGKLQVATARRVAPGLALAVPEALVLGLPETRNGEVAGGHRALHLALQDCDAALIGPGMQPSASVIEFVRRAARVQVAVVVLDAGALGNTPCAPDGFPFVLTPHAGEMAELCRASKEEVEAAPLHYATQLAHQKRSVVVLKGADTYIVAPRGHAWLHRGGVPGLGTSGSGDVLGGLIAGLAARGASALQAALWGVWLHAAAGRELSRSIGALGFLAREIPPRVPGLLDRFPCRTTSTR